jgi:uncharacterized RDD family membrane protein YckC
MSNKELNNSAPGLLKLGACFIYDALIVIALSFALAGLFLLVAGTATHGLKRYLLQLTLWFFIGIYFAWCWSRSGQTLAMKTWRLKLIGQDGNLLSLQAAFLRYMAASISLMLLGLGFLWAIVDRDNLYLHDRLLKNRIIAVPRNAAS